MNKIDKRDALVKNFPGNIQMYKPEDLEGFSVDDFNRMTQAMFLIGPSIPDFSIPPALWARFNQVNYEGEENNLYRD